MTVLHYDTEKHVLNAVYVPRLRGGRLVNPDPTPVLGETIWRGDFDPSPFGNHTKGELTEPHATPTPSIYLSAPGDVYDEDDDMPAGTPVKPTALLGRQLFGTSRLPESRWLTADERAGVA